MQALAAVSHGLRTPITRLRFRAEGIPDATARAAVAADLADMERMIDQTLAYLRGDPADQPARPLDLAALLVTLVDDACDAGGAATLSGVGPVVVVGRRLALKRAFANLIDNAVKYGGRAEVSVAEGDEAKVAIADAGPGIAPDDLERCFEPFVRLEPSRNRDTGGFGFGLAIARRVIEGHGGTVRLANAAGGGLIATVRLPTGERPAG
jgi:signal transduction histidine kinase